MPYSITSGAVLAITAESRLLEQQMVTTFHYRMFGSTITDGREAAIAAMVELNGGDKLWDKYAAACPTNVLGIKWYAQWITPTRYAFIESTRVAENGQVVGSATTANVCGVFVRRGEMADRKNNSVTHVPGLVPADIVAGKVGAAQLARMDELAGAAVVEIVLVGGQELLPCAFNRLVPASSRHMIEYEVQDTIRTMHRRTLRLGS